MTTTAIATESSQRHCPGCRTLLPGSSVHCPECHLALDWLARFPAFTKALAWDLPGHGIELRVRLSWVGGTCEITRAEPGTWEQSLGPGSRVYFEFTGPVGPLTIRAPNKPAATISLPMEEPYRWGDTEIKANLVAVPLGDSWPTITLARHDFTVSLVDGKTAVRIGRQARKVDVHIIDGTVAELHCVLARDRESARDWLLDAGSQTGTFLNRRRIVAAQLAAGDLVQVGRFAWVFNQSDGKLVPVAPVVGLELELREATVFKSPERRRNNARNSKDDSPQTRLGPLNLRIGRGTFVAVVGPSGSGKSTLIAALVGAPRALDIGEVEADGSSITKNRDWFRHRLGYVAQQENTARAGLTARQSVRLSALLRHGLMKEAVERLLSQVELEQRDWDAPISQLSGGQAKRARVATELVNEPGLLVLDEPGSGLDPDREKAVVRLLRALAYRGCTVIMVTHNWRGLEDVDRVLALRDGMVVFDGPPEELRDSIPTGDFADLDLCALAQRQTRPSMSVLFGALKALSVKVPWRALREIVWQFRVLSWRELIVLSNPISGRGNWRDMISEWRVAISALLIRPIAVIPATTSFADPVSFRSFPGVGKAIAHAQVLVERVKRWLADVDRTATSLQFVRKVATHGFYALRRVALGSLCVPLFFALALAVSVPATDVELLGFFTILATIWMGASLSLMSIVDEREVFDHERLLFLRVVPYVGAKMILFWTLAVAQTCVFAVLLMAFRSRGWLYGGNWPTVYLLPISLAASGMGVFISAIANRSAPAANLILALAMIAQIVFNVQVVGNGGTDLAQAYGAIHIHPCEADGCDRRAQVWLASMSTPVSGGGKPRLDVPQVGGWFCNVHGEAAGGEACNEWASLASYGTISRYGDIVLRSFAYTERDADAYLGRNIDQRSVQRRLDLHQRFGYAVWRRHALACLVGLIIGFPTAAAFVLWCQSKHVFTVPRWAKRHIAETARGLTAESA